MANFIVLSSVEEKNKMGISGIVAQLLLEPICGNPRLLSRFAHPPADSRPFAQQRHEPRAQ
jgi:hypothetical protein